MSESRRSTPPLLHISSCLHLHVHASATVQWNASSVGGLSVSQQASDLLSVTAHLFVYNQHHQQLVWDQSAVTEHHEHSLPCVCLTSLGAVSAGLPEHWSSQLFEVTTVQNLSTSISAHKHFFQKPRVTQPLREAVAWRRWTRGSRVWGLNHCSGWESRSRHMVVS